jgi:DNA-binding SARP family transcriptional activator/ATP/maltotriose-dependent transcriptional regulator MalT
MPNSPVARRLDAPDFGDMVDRNRLVGLFHRVRPSLCVIAAPAAYGKSVLAAQLCANSRFAASAWVRLPARCESGRGMLAAVLAALASDPLSPDSEYIALDRHESLIELCLLLDDVVSRTTGESTCLVLDNLAMPEPGALEETADAMRQCRSLSCCIVTVRTTAALPRLPLDALSICADDLLLDSTEACEVMAAVMGERPEPAVAQFIVDASGGQAGLLSLVARHAAASSGGLPSGPPIRADLKELIVRLAESQLDERQRFTLAAMAILGEGTRRELAAIPGCDVSADGLREIAMAVPVVRVRLSPADATFVTHDLAQKAFGGPESLLAASGPTLDAIIATLADRGEWDRLLRVVMDCGDSERLCRWLSAVGVRALRQGSEELLDAALARVDPTQFINEPRLLLIRAATMRENGRVEQACRDAQIARELAEQGGDTVATANALLILAEVASLRGDYALALAYLEGAIESRDGRVPSEVLSTLCGRRLMMTALYCDDERVMSAEYALMDVPVGHDGDAARYGAMRSFFLGTVRGCYWGDWAGAARLLDTAKRCRSLPTSVRIAASYNYLGAMIEMARVEEASRAWDEHVSMVSSSSDERWSLSASTARVLLDLSTGECAEAFATVISAARDEWEASERLSATTALLSTSTALLGHGRLEEATMMSELAAEYADESGTDLLQCLARLGTAACLLAIGDVGAAAAMAGDVQKRLARARTNYVLLQAALLSAQATALQGRGEAAVACLSMHSDYMLSESANWLVAMYIRAFPELLEVVAAAVGVDRVPSRVLRMLVPPHVNRALATSQGILTQGQIDDLDERLARCRKRATRQGDVSSGPPSCRVRLFGGLRVEIDGRPLEDKSWRKRKARLLFAMMTARCGRDIPRDQLIAYLWPEMDEQQALNNFYVAWSCMKHALAPHLKRGDVCAFVEHRGGVCRTAAGRVTTDVDEFDAALSAAAQARSAGDAAAELASLQSAAELYRGEVLPGEVYDDWFSALRERCRHDFEDAMLRAAKLLEARGDLGGGLSLLRRALQHDPWREDLYQAALRLQMAAGQRSAAVETYLACRTRLVEDLGIDPSGETMSLYEQVLGMEERSGTIDYGVGGRYRAGGATADA